MQIADVIKAVERYACPRLQESWDNTGLQVGYRTAECTGVLVAFDPTAEVVDEAVELGCNLIVAHHPLIFRPVKRLVGDTNVEITAMKALAKGVAIYSSHTAADSTKGGVSYELARLVGVTPDSVLQPVEAPADCQYAEAYASLPDVGLGVAGMLATPCTALELVERVKTAIGSKAVRTTAYPMDAMITRVAMCGGAGGEFIGKALSMGAQAYITADVKYHDFVDYRDKLLVIDAGHYETEAPIKQVFAKIISDALPNLPVYCTNINDNPINYL